MRRCLIGFSTPLGYGYSVQASKTKNDLNSSPNPFLMGSVGIFTLYDEIWFTCESLCPENMRKLPYVKFLDVEYPSESVSVGDLECAAEFVELPRDASYNDAFEEGYRAIPSMFGENLAIDNHTHGLDYYGANLGGNPTSKNLAVDLMILRVFARLDLELILNPITSLIGLADLDGTSGFFNEKAYRELRLADRLVSLENSRNLSSPNGPYHESLEYIRNDRMIKDFRKWLCRSTDRWGNRTISDIEAEVDGQLEELQLRCLDQWGSQFTIKQLGVDLIKGALGPLYTIAEFGGRQAVAREQKAFTFMARSQRRQRRRRK